MKNSSFNQNILGKRLRDDASRWNSEPSEASSQETLRSIRRSFREPQTGKGPALMPAFVAAMALALIVAVLSTFKESGVTKTPSPDNTPQETALEPLKMPTLPSTESLLSLLHDNPVQQEAKALQHDLQGTFEFLLDLVPSTQG